MPILRQEERQVDGRMAEHVAKSWRCPHVLVSSKTGLNVNGKDRRIDVNAVAFEMLLNICVGGAIMESLRTPSRGLGSRLKRFITRTRGNCAIS